MYDHEIALFEAATTRKKTTFSTLNLSLIVLLIISIWLAIEVVEIRLYLITWTVIDVVIIGFLIHKTNQKNKQLAKEAYGQFIELFYQVMIKSQDFYQKHPLQVIAPKSLNVTPRVMSDVLDDTMKYHHVAKLVNPTITIDIIDVHIAKSQVQRKITLSTTHLDDVSFELRSLKKPTNTYTFKSRIRGYNVFASSQLAVKPYIQMFDKMRVHPMVDQLDVSFRDDTFVAAYKLSKMKVPLETKTTKKNLMLHENYVNTMIETINHILTILKEIQ